MNIIDRYYPLAYIVNKGKIYSLYEEFGRKNGHSDVFVSRNKDWVKIHEHLKKDNSCKILFEGKHLTFPNTFVCIVKININNEIYKIMIGREGLKIPCI